MIPKLMIMTLGTGTHVFLDGKRISKGVEDLVYSARDDKGNLCPTLQLLKVNVNDFSLENDVTLKELLKDMENLSNSSDGASVDEIEEPAPYPVNPRSYQD